MKILFCGDLVGRSGRDVVLENLPALRTEMALDFVVVNAENAAHGFGLTREICEELFEAGADAITTGNHVWDQREILDAEPILRIHARPKRRFNYDRVVFIIAENDGAILGAEYFKRGSDEPYRVLSAPRSHMVETGGHVLPTRMRVENRMKGSHTDVALHNLRTDQEIDDRIFSVRTLESGRDLPGTRDLK